MLFESEPDWVTFFREILGVDGVVRRQFTRLEDLTAFEKSPEFEQIQKWLNSPEYQELRKVGEKFAKFRNYAVPGLPQ